jgi:uncharacterized RDD family membrane protein YckC
MSEAPPRPVAPSPPRPAEVPELYRGLLGRRALAFLIDALAIGLLATAAAILVGILGVFTAGLAWLFLGVVFPAVALGYYALTLGGRAATPGMQALGIEVRLMDGSTPTPIQACAHALLFYVTVFLLTPFVLLVGLFNERGRLLHDLVLGTLAVDAGARRLLAHGSVGR